MGYLRLPGAAEAGDQGLGQSGMRCDGVRSPSASLHTEDSRTEATFQDLLHGNDVDIEAVAAEVGYDDGPTLRTLLGERLGREVRDCHTELR
jgi:hypothetical protein